MVSVGGVVSMVRVCLYVSEILPRTVFEFEVDVLFAILTKAYLYISVIDLSMWHF